MPISNIIFSQIILAQRTSQEAFGLALCERFPVPKSRSTNTGPEARWHLWILMMIARLN